MTDDTPAKALRQAAAAHVAVREAAVATAKELEAEREAEAAQEALEAQNDGGAAGSMAGS